MNITPAFIRRRIAHRPNLLKIVENIGWLFFDKILRMGVGLLVGVWVARYLGPAQYGLLNFALAFTGLFGTIASLGLQGIVVRDIVRDPQGARLTLGSAAMMQLAGGGACFLLILEAISYLRPDDPLSRTIVAILGAMMLLKASEIAMYWFESQVQSKYTVWVQNSVFLVFAAVKVGLILLEAPLTAFVWAMLVEAVVVAAMMLMMFSLRGPQITQLQVQMRRAKTLLKNSWPLILSGLAVNLYMKIDQIMLGQMAGNEAVGIYSSATRISEIWYFIPTVICASLLPSILEAKKRGEEYYFESLQRIYDLMVVLSVSLALPMTFLGPYIIGLLFGESYKDAGIVLAIHIWAGVFVFLGVARGIWTLAENMQRLDLVFVVGALLINIVGNYLVIPKYGPAGAAWMTVFSQLCSVQLLPLLNRNTRKSAIMTFKSMNVMAMYLRYKR